MGSKTLTSLEVDARDRDRLIERLNALTKKYIDRAAAETDPDWKQKYTELARDAREDATKVSNCPNVVTVEGGVAEVAVGDCCIVDFDNLEG